MVFSELFLRSEAQRDLSSLGVMAGVSLIPLLSCLPLFCEATLGPGELPGTACCSPAERTEVVCAHGKTALLMAAKKVLRKGIKPSTIQQSSGTWAGSLHLTSAPVVRSRWASVGALQGILGALEGAANIQSQRYRQASLARVNTVTASKTLALWSLTSWEQQKKGKAFWVTLKSSLADCSTQETVYAVCLTHPQGGRSLLGARAVCSELHPAWVCLLRGWWGNTAPVLPNTAFATPSSPPGTFPQPALNPQLCCGELAFHLWC